MQRILSPCLTYSFPLYLLLGAIFHLNFPFYTPIYLTSITLIKNLNRQTPEEFLNHKIIFPRPSNIPLTIFPLSQKTSIKSTKNNETQLKDENQLKNLPHKKGQTLEFPRCLFSGFSAPFQQAKELSRVERNSLT